VKIDDGRWWRLWEAGSPAEEEIYFYCDQVRS